MNVKGGFGIHYPTIQGSPAFLNRSIYHARKSLTRLNIRISDICWMHFVQIRFSPSLSGVYRLWNFEEAIPTFFDFSSPSAPKIPAYPPRIFRSRVKTARGALIYKAK